MKRKRKTAEEDIKKLRRADRVLSGGNGIEDVCRSLEFSPATYHGWVKEYAGANLDTVNRLKELQKENARLKKLGAEQALDMAMLKEVAEGNGKPHAEESCRGDGRLHAAVALPSQAAAISRRTSQAEGPAGSLAVEACSRRVGGRVESFHALVSLKLMDRELFFNLWEDNAATSNYAYAYNLKRPHGSLGNRPPSLAAQRELPLQFALALSS